MPIFLLKSLFSLAVLASALTGIFTAFEIFGRAEQKFNRDTLRKIHRANGILYLVLCLGLTYLCFGFLVRTKAEPSVRVTFHALFAVSVLLLLSFKILVTTIYRQFYAKLQTAGLILALFSLCMIATSAGYYLLITKLGKEIPAVGSSDQKKAAGAEQAGMIARTDPESITKGKELYEDKCTFCHDPLTNKTLTGPGHKGILKNPRLPVSGKPAIPDNIAAQLRSPFKDMPSFSYLSDEEVLHIIAYLNTL
ncbi:MAG: c-type cytochrome [Nitrospirae bacterium]|nr:c-type cytochrome [Nitrospirota bacterium]